MKLLTEQQQETVEQLFAIVGSADKYYDVSEIEEIPTFCSIYDKFHHLWRCDKKDNIRKFKRNFRELVNQFIDENNLSDKWIFRNGYLFSSVDLNDDDLFDLFKFIDEDDELSYFKLVAENPHRQIRYQFLQWLEAKLK